MPPHRSLAGTVLLVEETEDRRELARIALEADGHRVLCADSGDGALALLRAGETPQVILVGGVVADVEFFRGQQREIAQAAGVPVIGLWVDAAVAPSSFDAVIPRREHPTGRETCEVVAETLRAARLAHVERLASLGKLSAGIVHEVKNPLTAVVCAVETLRRQLDSLLSTVSDPASRKRLGEIGDTLDVMRQGSDHMERLVRDVRLLSHPDQASRAPIDLREIARGVVRLLERQVNERGELSVELLETPAVFGNSGAITQVVMNLLANAMDACQACARPVIALSTGASADGSQAMIEVRDNGHGMPSHVREHVFDAFFTTKSATLGTGLGLWLAQRIVAAHGGRIEVESEPGAGATFRVWLPAILRPSLYAVLVVAEEGAMSRLCERMLRTHVQVRAAHDLSLAAALLREERFDAVLIDEQGLPSGGVPDLLAAARIAGVRRIVLLGGDLQRVATRDRDVAIVDKPFDRATLLTALRWRDTS